MRPWGHDLFDVRRQALTAMLGRHLHVIVVTLIGAVATIMATAVVWLQVDAHQRTEFQWLAEDRNRALKKGVEDDLKAVHFLGDLLRVSPDIQPQDFRLIAAALRERYPGIHSLEWLPRVTDAERQRHEAAVNQGAPGYRITERAPDGAQVKADRRPDYFPVLFQEPSESGSAPLGFDRGSDRIQRALIERATRSGEMVVSGRVSLDPEAGRFGVMVFDPVYDKTQERTHRHASERPMLGFLVGMLGLAELATSSIAVLEPRGVEFLVLDESAPAGEQFLDFYGSRLGPEPVLVEGKWQGWNRPDAPRVTELFRVADREWSITCAATTHYRSAEGFKEGPWIVLGSGIALTLLVVLFMHSVRAQMDVRLKIERELRESEQKLRILFNQSPDIIMTVDNNARILMANRPMPKAPTGSAIGQSSVKILPKGLRDWYRSAVNKVFRTGEPDHFQYSQPDSSCWEVRIVPLRVGGLVNSAMVIATDVTERRLFETQAIRTARLATLGVLSASVAHEINNPNNAIQFNASLLQKSFADIVPILQREAAARGPFLVGGVPVSQALEGLPRMLVGLARNSKRIQNIIVNLKHVARQDAGDYDQPVELGKVLQSVYSILQHEIQKHTDYCELELPESLPPIRGNAQQLEQVFINLVLNALQALPTRSARLWIAAETAPDSAQVQVSVIDQGNGIRDDDLQRIFDPFFTTRPEQGGTGLGLSISQRIIQNHGGSIEINSQLGVGTEVTVRLPVAASA